MKSSQPAKTSATRAPGADIIINATPNELRVALIEEGRLAEIYLDVPDKQRTVGSIYLGRVQKVLQGMNAAFVDIGLDQDAFLHFSDVGSAFDEFREFLDGDDDDDEKGAEVDGAEKKALEKAKDPRNEKRGEPRGGDRKKEPKQAEAARATAPQSDAAPDAQRDDRREKGRDDRKQRPEAVAAPETEAPAIETTHDSEHEANGDTDENGEGRKKRRRGRRGGRRRRKQRDGIEEGQGTAPEAPQQNRDDRSRDNRRENDRSRTANETPVGERAEAAQRTVRSKPTDAERSAPEQQSTEAVPAKPRGTKRTAPQPAESTTDEAAPAAKRRSTKKSDETPAAEGSAEAPATKRAPRKRPVEASEESSVAQRAADAITGATTARRAARPKKGAAEETPAAADTPTPTKRRASRSKKSDEGDAPVRSNTVASALPTFQTKRSGTITIALERGQDIMVQVTRESYSSKGVRVASKISLPGRFLVLLPLDPGIGISRKVQSEKERRRLRRIARSILPEGHGCIIRTVAEGRDEEVIRQDLTALVERWKTIEERVRQTEPPALLYRESSIAGSMMRDLLTRDVGRIMIDNREMYDALSDYVAWAAPWLVGNVHFHPGPQPVFEKYGVERELDRMMEPKIYTPSGGYIIIDRTEAMTVIDVNSGRFVGKKDQEQNALKTNLEAAREIARQLRLRDVGGLIVVDFIDLDDERNRKKVCDELKREMRNDKAKSVVLPMTQFGIVQMTRQRIRQQVVETLTQPCACCNGTGSLRSRSVTARALERWLERFHAGSRERHLTLRAHPDLVSYLSEGEGVGSRLTEIMRRSGVELNVAPDATLGLDTFHLFSVRTGLDMTREFARDKRGNAAATPLPPYILPPGVAPLEEERRSERPERAERPERRRDERSDDANDSEAPRKEGREPRPARDDRRAPQPRGEEKNRRDQRRNEPRPAEQSATPVEATPVEQPGESTAAAERGDEARRNDRRRSGRRGGRGRGGERRENESTAPDSGTATLPESMAMPLDSENDASPRTESRKPAARPQRQAAKPAEAETPAVPAEKPTARRSAARKSGPKETAPEAPTAQEAEAPKKRAPRAKKAAASTEAPAEVPAAQPKEKAARAPRKASTARGRGAKSGDSAE